LLVDVTTRYTKSFFHVLRTPETGIGISPWSVSTQQLNKWPPSIYHWLGSSCTTLLKLY
jgi:hypothetical protein